MKVLAIDISGLTATVAILDEIQTDAEYTVNYKKTQMCIRDRIYFIVYQRLFLRSLHKKQEYKIRKK